MNENLLLLLGAGGIAAMAVGPGPVQGVGLLVVLIVIFKMLRKLEGAQNWKAIQAALSDYEEIINGKNWVGKDAEVLASDRDDDPTKSGPVRFVQVCRTKNGAWFLFQVAVIHGRLVDRCITPCDEAEAKSRLRHHRDIYVRLFGQPTIA